MRSDSDSLAAENGSDSLLPTQSSTGSTDSEGDALYVKGLQTTSERLKVRLSSVKAKPQVVR